AACPAADQIPSRACKNIRWNSGFASSTGMKEAKSASCTARSGSVWGCAVTERAARRRSGTPFQRMTSGYTVLYTRTELRRRAMLENKSRIQKYALGFAAMFLGVYLLDYVPGIMADNGKMFGLFSMTPIVDLGHLVLGALALISGLISAKLARIYFWA